MTIQTVPTFMMPHNISVDAGVQTAVSATAAATATLDAVDEALAIVFSCPAGTSLTDIAFRTQTVSVTSGPLNFDCRLETLTNARPSGTLWAANTNAAVSVATTDDNVWKTATLTAAATVAQGDLMAIVIKAPGAGTFSFTLGGFGTGWQAPSGALPVIVADVDASPEGTYETLITAAAPSIAIKISGVWYRIEPFAATLTAAVTAFNSGSASDEYAMRFTSPVGLRVKGASVSLHNVAAGADFTVSLWPDSAGSQTDGSALAQVVCDGDIVGSNAIDSTVNVHFPSSVTLTADAIYWLGVRADTANNISVPTIAAADVATMAAMPGGAGSYLGTRAWSAGSANAFGTTTTTVPLFALMIDGIDLPAAGGGLIRHPGMAGGLNA